MIRGTPDMIFNDLQPIRVKTVDQEKTEVFL